MGQVGESDSSKLHESGTEYKKFLLAVNGASVVASLDCSPFSNPH